MIEQRAATISEIEEDKLKIATFTKFDAFFLRERKLLSPFSSFSILLVNAN
jgi:hypothetical protein